MGLDEETYKNIMKLYDKAEKHVEVLNFDKAIVEYEEALELLPGEKTEFDVATLILTAMGDAMMMACEYETAKNYYMDAIECADGVVNPYILFSIGQCYYLNEEFDGAKEFFLKTYEVDGDHLFEDGEPAYFELIKDDIK